MFEKLLNRFRKKSTYEIDIYYDGYGGPLDTLIPKYPYYISKAWLELESSFSDTCEDFLNAHSVDEFTDNNPFSSYIDKFLDTELTFAHEQCIEHEFIIANIVEKQYEAIQEATLRLNELEYELKKSESELELLEVLLTQNSIFEGAVFND